MILISKATRIISPKIRGFNMYLRQRTKKTSICQLSYANYYLFSSQSLLTSVKEVQQGRKYFDQKYITLAEQMFERALLILPFYIQNNDEYNAQFSKILYQLIISYTWKGSIKKVDVIINKLKNQSSKGIKIKGENFNKINLILELLGRNKCQVAESYQQIKNNIQLTKNYQKEQNYQIQKELTATYKNLQNNIEDTQKWIHGQLNNTWLFIITSLLSRNNIATNQNYNKICNSLLKNTERSSAKNVIKPLILIITNLLRNSKYLQAEGMLTYCLDRKRQNLKQQLLVYNQQYILLNLLLGRSYLGVDRVSQAQNLFNEYRPIFNLQILLLQGYLIDSI